jgi:hypothetical protein
LYICNERKSNSNLFLIFDILELKEKTDFRFIVNYKTKKKNAIVPRTDANQGVRERNARIEKQNQYIINKIAEYKAHQEAMRQQSSAGQTIDGLN